MTEINDINQYTASTRLLYADEGFSDEWSSSPPIHQSVSGIAKDAEEFAKISSAPLEERFYARHGNPTSSRLAKVITNLEGGECGIAFAAGQGATTTALMTFLKAGDHVIAQKNHYMGTSKMVTQILPKYGVEATVVDQRSVQNFEEAVRPNTKLILLETPVNPLMYITDIKGVCDIARSKNILTFCDNTFATPINQRPIEQGVDIVMHSTTKYIGGHHDLLGGSLTASRELCEQIWDMSMNIGAIPAPFNSWLALRGIRTLGLRVKQQNASAQAISEFLENHTAVSQVFYPGLETHPQHQLAKSQMSGFGGVLTFVLKGGYDAGRKFIERVKLAHHCSIIETGNNSFRFAQSKNRKIKQA
ncbi:trans-sulfuration enzyme family protein [Paremcibacter congregatus]|uniref:trans-sulfuration enzyme family protein n=1 Tax=Paremcibacter congregatus TaxID=2043170 RepID=UPI00112077F2|nr:aminotransferase class I/II-fold pyridoxal phosphate-dependent enzyme [Paremcibacter congregatus]QDE27648.1 aminotransferase class I/II-fold pyridoxal phosphate-dependent enzyme [Paremcibacter congregatus]